ncbi:MAG: ferritin-like domain-containing protein, partial [Actinobacteria bacterium]|nr:ferritin-like domain-containing protein [Actinomycetota bacterium]
MSTHRYALPVEETQWRIPGHSEAVFNWEYDEGRHRLLNLYEKGKEKQWNANTRIDWSLDVDTTNTDVMPDEYVPIFGSPTWERLSRDEKNVVRHHMATWMNSQFLHGEQGALICASKIVQTVPDVDSKFYAATQVMDEARHVEAYSRYLNEKLEMAYPINPHLATLLDQTITDGRWDMTYLGMQVMIEGVALAAFSMIRDFTQDPLGKSLNAYVMQDEARHVAFGSLALQDAYAELTEKEREEREEFVVEASYLLKDRFLAEEVWENLGFDTEECVEYVDNAQLMGEFRKALFSRVVPT